jgi:hypothetical protein
VLIGIQGTILGVITGAVLIIADTGIITTTIIIITTIMLIRAPETIIMDTENH